MSKSGEPGWLRAATLPLSPSQSGATAAGRVGEVEGVVVGAVADGCCLEQAAVAAPTPAAQRNVRLLIPKPAPPGAIAPFGGGWC